MKHIYNGMLFNNEKEQNNAFCSKLGGLRDYHTEWSQTTERQISYDIGYMWNLKKRV